MSVYLRPLAVATWQFIRVKRKGEKESVKRDRDRKCYIIIEER